MYKQVNGTTLILKPHWRQFCIAQLHLVVVMVACIITYCTTNLWHWCAILLLLMAAALATYLLYAMADLMRLSYTITKEQIIIQHGVFVHATDYIELYRVVDYQQSRTLMQQLTGLMTVKILSGDRNTPILNIIGMKKEWNVIREIRKRVEYNKQKKGIYEITNRM